VRLDGTLTQLSKGQDLPLRTCDGQPLKLAAGDHRLQTAPGWLADLVDLASRPGGAAAGAAAAAGGAGSQAAAPRVSVISSSASGATLTTEAAQGPYYLVLGQGYDPRWQATIDGQPLGPPQVIDGYAVGWRIADRQEHRIAVRFGPQRWALASLAASLAGLILVAVLLVLPWWRRATAAQPAAPPAARPQPPATRAQATLPPAQGPPPAAPLPQPPTPGREEPEPADGGPAP
jgi:arabinofuranan 3-O-arabinosyltransferase